MNSIRVNLDLAIILREQQRVVSLSNKIKNFNNKLKDLSILFIVLFSLDFKSIAFFELFFIFNFEIILSLTLLTSISFLKLSNY